MNGGDMQLHPTPVEIENIKNSSLRALTININNLITERGLKQKTIADRLGLSGSQISRLLDQDNNKKTIDQLVRIAASLGLHIKFDFAPIQKIESKFKNLDERDLLNVHRISEFKGL